MFTDLETDRLYLKSISTDDRDFIFRQFSDEQVNRYLFDAEPLTEITGADEIIDFYLEPEPRSQHRWIIVQKSDGTKVGTCGYHCWDRKEGTVDVGYDLNACFWGKGYMGEAMKEIITFAAAKMAVKEINASIYVENHASIRLAEKLGFVQSGTCYELFRGEKYLHNRYSLVIDGFPQLAK